MNTTKRNYEAPALHVEAGAIDATQGIDIVQAPFEPGTLKHRVDAEA